MNSSNHRRFYLTDRQTDAARCLLLMKREVLEKEEEACRPIFSLVMQFYQPTAQRKTPLLSQLVVRYITRTESSRGGVSFFCSNYACTISSSPWQAGWLGRSGKTGFFSCYLNAEWFKDAAREQCTWQCNESPFPFPFLTARFDFSGFDRLRKIT